MPSQPTNPRVSKKVLVRWPTGRGQRSSVLLAKFTSVAELDDDAQAHRSRQPQPKENSGDGFIAGVQQSEDAEDDRSQVNGQPRPGSEVLHWSSIDSDYGGLSDTHQDRVAVFRADVSAPPGPVPAGGSATGHRSGLGTLLAITRSGPARLSQRSTV